MRPRSLDADDPARRRSRRPAFDQTQTEPMIEFLQQTFGM